MYQILFLRCHLQSERCRRLQETLKQLQKQMLQRTCRAPSKPRRSYWCCGSCYTDTSMKIIRLHTLWQPDISNLFGSNCSLPVSSMSKQHGQVASLSACQARLFHELRQSEGHCSQGWIYLPQCWIRCLVVSIWVSIVIRETERCWKILTWGSFGLKLSVL